MKNRFFAKVPPHRLPTKFGICLIAMLASAGNAAVLTVGPGGDFLSVQAAVDAAGINGQSDEIRLAEAVFIESISMIRLSESDGLTISGGWDPTFSQVVGTSAISAGGMGRVFEINIRDGDVVELIDLIIEDGAAEFDAGISATVTDATLRLLRSTIRNNVAAAERSGGGGGTIRAGDGADVRLNGVSIAGNRVECTTTFSCSVGGLALSGTGDVYFEVTNSVIENNRVDVPEGQGINAGMSIGISDGGTVVFNDNIVRDNIVQADNAGIVGVTISAEVQISAARNQVVRNLAESEFPEFSSQMRVNAFADAQVVVESTLVADGNGDGLVTRLFADGTNPSLHLVNLTIANHDDVGLQATSLLESAAFTISNVIVTSSRLDLSASDTVVQNTNLLGVQGLFVNASAGNYQLANNAEAIDAGTFPAPVPIGSGDAAGLTRIVGGAIDIGAFEFGADRIFFNSFEAAETLRQ